MAKARNVKFGVKGSKLVLTIDLEALVRGEVELSESGKSYVIATTHGNQKLTISGYEDVRISLNAFIPKDCLSKYYKPEPKVEQKAEKIEQPKPEKAALEKQLVELTKMVVELNKQIAALK